jgi:hypothetical protein
MQPVILAPPVLMSEHVVASQPVVQTPVLVPAGSVAVPVAPQPAVVVPGVVVPASEAQREPVKPVRFTAYPNFVVVWPVIVLGLLFWLLASAMGTEYPARVASSVWLFSLFAVMIALGFDLDSTETAFVVLTVIVILLTLQLIAFSWQVAVFSWIATHLSMLEVNVSSQMMLVVSILLGVPYLLMLVFARLNNHWTVVPGKMIRTTFGKNEEEIPINSTKTVNYHFYDIMMRWLCFGAGDLVVSTDRGEKRIGYVLWAKRRDRGIEPFETMPISGPPKENR